MRNVATQWNEKDRAELNWAVVHLRNTVTESENILRREIFNTGSLSMAIYRSCSRDLTDRLASFQFDVVIGFVTWTLVTFATGLRSQVLGPRATVTRLCREVYAKFE
jgi:hypothetical protein